MTTITVTSIKSDWDAPEYYIYIDGVGSYDYEQLSNLLTQSSSNYVTGMLNTKYHIVEFTRNSTTVEVDFGTTWGYSKYENPAAEIARRVCLVRDAFEVARESYEKSWTVTI
jgi:hypothetical protein